MPLKRFIKKIYTKAENKNLPNESYIKTEIVNVKEEDVEMLLDNEEAINKKLSNTTSLSKYVTLVKTMIAMIKDIKNGAYKNVPWFTIATIVFVLLYVLNPMDIVPDFIPGVGFIDDLTLLTIAIGWIETDINRYKNWKITEEKR